MSNSHFKADRKVENKNEFFVGPPVTGFETHRSGQRSPIIILLIPPYRTRNWQNFELSLGLMCGIATLQRSVMSKIKMRFFGPLVRGFGTQRSGQRSPIIIL